MEEKKLKTAEFMSLYTRELSEACLLAKKMLKKLEVKVLSEPTENLQTFHRLKGVSAIIGFNELGSAAGNIERLLKEPSPNTRDLEPCLNEFIALVEKSELLK